MGSISSRSRKVSSPLVLDNMSISSSFWYQIEYIAKVADGHASYTLPDRCLGVFGHKPRLRKRVIPFYTGKHTVSTFSYLWQVS